MSLWAVKHWARTGGLRVRVVRFRQAKHPGRWVLRIYDGPRRVHQHDLGAGTEAHAWTRAWEHIQTTIPQLSTRPIPTFKDAPDD